MSVHYKFKSSVEYDTLAVDGVNISLGDLKDGIIQQKRLGRGQPYDLQVTNAETKEVYTDNKTLIPKNSSLIVARIPIDPALMKKSWEGNKDATALLLSNPANLMNTEDAVQAAEIGLKIQSMTDITKLAGSEKDKINVMMAQSTLDYHPSRYVKLRNSYMSGKVPQSYKCYKCHQGGHWVINCPLNNQDLRKSTGIPSKFLKEIDDPNTPGAMITANGKFVIFRSLSAEEKSKVSVQDRPPVPSELLCNLCKELLKNPVYTPCCVNAFCDECIRNHLLDSEENFCASCDEKNILPETLVPCRYLRVKCVDFDHQCFFNIISQIGDQEPDTPPASPPNTTNIVPEVSNTISEATATSSDKDDEPTVMTISSPSDKEKEKETFKTSLIKDVQETLYEEEKKRDSSKSDVIVDCEEIDASMNNDKSIQPSDDAVHSDSDADSLMGNKLKHKKKKKSHDKKEKKEKKIKKEKKTKKQRKGSESCVDVIYDFVQGENVENKQDVDNEWITKSKWDSDKDSPRKSHLAPRERHNSDIYDDMYDESSAPPVSLPNIAPSSVATYSSPNEYRQPPPTTTRIHSVIPPTAAYPYSVPPPNLPIYQQHETIDDPLAAFEKIMKEKDEQKRLNRRRRRSRTRSRSPSFMRGSGFRRSRSPSPYMRSISRSPLRSRRSPVNSPRKIRRSSPLERIESNMIPTLNRESTQPFYSRGEPPFSRSHGDGFGPRGRGRGGRRGMVSHKGYLSEGYRGYPPGNRYMDEEDNRREMDRMRHKDESHKRYSSDEEMRPRFGNEGYKHYRDEKPGDRYSRYDDRFSDEESKHSRYEPDLHGDRYSRRDGKRKPHPRFLEDSHRRSRSRSRSRSPRMFKLSPKDKNQDRYKGYEMPRDKRERDYKKFDKYGEDHYETSRRKNKDNEKKEKDRSRKYDDDLYDKGMPAKDPGIDRREQSLSREQEIKKNLDSRFEKNESNSWSDIENDKTSEQEIPPHKSEHIPFSDKIEGDKSIDNTTEDKAEKRKHDKKKKKKDKRRNSQASTDASHPEESFEGDDKKKKKKEKKSKKLGKDTQLKMEPESVSISNTDTNVDLLQSPSKLADNSSHMKEELGEGYVLPELSIDKN